MNERTAMRGPRRAMLGVRGCHLGRGGLRVTFDLAYDYLCESAQIDLLAATLDYTPTGGGVVSMSSFTKPVSEVAWTTPRRPIPMPDTTACSMASRHLLNTRSFVTRRRTLH